MSINVPQVNTLGMDPLEKSYWLDLQHDYICERVYDGTFVTNIAESEVEKVKLEYGEGNIKFDIAYDCFGNRLEGLVAVIRI